jgi:tRNA A-37 threonylcarbamoyl transferase component Bud32
METGNQTQCLMQQFSLIEKITDTLRNQLGRSLRVLDFESNQGIFDAYLTDAGDHVLTVNYNNIDQINLLLPDIDVVLALNQSSLEFITPLKNNIFLLTGPIYKHFQSLIDIFAYYEHIPTEKNSILFCSNGYWYADGQLRKFNSWADFSHELDTNAHANTRRYYFSEQLILKYYRFTKDKTPENQEELSNEINFLINHSATTPYLPKLNHYKINADDGWLLREKISGLSFHKVINEGVVYDAMAVVSNLLYQLTILEQQSLYHTDLRTWNLLLNEQGEVRFIDYGAIKRTTTDMLHRKKHVFMSFLLLAYEIINRTIIEVRHFTPAHIHPKYYPENFRIWLMHLLSIDFSQWSFGLFLKLLNTKDNSSADALRIAESMKLWLEVVEPGVESPRYRKKHFERLFIKRLNYSVAREARKQSRQRINISRLFPLWVK